MEALLASKLGLYPDDYKKFVSWSTEYPGPYSVIRVGGGKNFSSDMPFVFRPSTALASFPPQMDYITPNVYANFVLEDAKKNIYETGKPNHLYDARIIYQMENIVQKKTKIKSCPIM